MKPSNPTLLALLNSDTFLMADLYTITLSTGAHIRWTSSELPITYGGNTFTPMLVKRGTTRITTGVQADTLDLTIYEGGGNSLDNYATINGLSIPAFANKGGFDAAQLLLQRAFLSSWTATPEVIYIFSGVVSDVSPRRTEVDMTVNSWMFLLNTKLPRNLYTAGCRHQHYGSGCGLVKSTYAHNLTANTSTNRVVSATTTQPTGFFDQGTLIFTSGDLTGVTRTIKTYTSGGSFKLINPLLQAPASGDTFQAYPGCDKNLTTCGSKFSNSNNFGGQPFIPAPENAV